MNNEWSEDLDGLHGMHFDRQGDEISLRRWVDLTENRQTGYYRIAETWVEGVRISTVWIGLDMGFNGYEPLIFETMVFDWRETEGGERGESIGALQRRYPTESEARIGHEAVIDQVRQYLRSAGIGASRVWLEKP